MKVIIAGCRTFYEHDKVAAFPIVCNAIHLSPFCAPNNPTEVVCGMARGADLAGKYWAESLGIPVRLFRADWDYWGRVAGRIRNGQMAEYVGKNGGGGLLAFWDLQSTGTSNMIYNATRYDNIEICVVDFFGRPIQREVWYEAVYG